jgi:hypothetical protein
MSDFTTQQTAKPGPPAEAKLPPRPRQSEPLPPSSGVEIDEAKFLKIAEKGKDQTALVAAMRESGIRVIFFERVGREGIRPAEQLNDPRDRNAAKFYATKVAEEPDLNRSSAQFLAPGEYHNVAAIRKGERRPFDDRPLLLLLKDVDRGVLLHGLAQSLAKTEPLQKLDSLKVNVDNSTRLRIRDWQLSREDVETISGLILSQKNEFTPKEAQVASEYYQIQLKLMLLSREADIARFIEKHSKRVGLTEAEVDAEMDRTKKSLDRMISLVAQLMGAPADDAINEPAKPGIFYKLPSPEQQNLRPLVESAGKKLFDYIIWQSIRSSANPEKNRTQYLRPHLLRSDAA